MDAVHQENRGRRERILAREGAAGVSAAQGELPRGMDRCVLKQQELRDGLVERWHPPESAEMERRYGAALRAMTKGQRPRQSEVAGQPADSEAIRDCIRRCPAQAAAVLRVVFLGRECGEAALMGRSPGEVVAACLVMLGAKAGARVLACLEEEDLGRSVRAVAAEREVPNRVGLAALKWLGQRLARGDRPGLREGKRETREQEPEGQVQASRVSGGGIEALVAILKASEVVVAGNVLRHLESEEPALAEVVRQAANPFEGLAGWSDRDLQGLLRRLDRRELAKALHWASELLQERLLSNMSPRMQHLLREEMDRLGAVPRSAARVAQDRLLRQISLWREEGESFAL